MNGCQVLSVVAFIREKTSFSRLFSFLILRRSTHLTLSHLYADFDIPPRCIA